MGRPEIIYKRRTKYIDSTSWPCLVYAHWIPFRSVRLTLKKMGGCPGHDAKLYLMATFLFGKFRNCDVLLHCHYFQVHSDSKVVLPVGVPSVGLICIYPTSPHEQNVTTSPIFKRSLTDLIKSFPSPRAVGIPRLKTSVCHSIYQ